MRQAINYPGAKSARQWTALLLGVVSLANPCLKGQPSSALVQGVSVAAPGLNPLTPSGGDSTGGTLSADGRMVAFVSSAANLTTNTHHRQVLDVYVRDRQTGVTSLVSASVDGRSGGDDHSTGPSLSADGRWVVFESRAKNLVTNSVSGAGDIYVRDLAIGRTRLVSVSPSGQGGNGASQDACITPDGRFVVFESDASDLVANDTNAATDVFVRDLQAETTTVVSLNWQSTASAACPAPVRLWTSTAPVISPDGRYVAFQSWATNLVSGTPLPYSQIYVRDLMSGTNFLASASPTGQPGSGDSQNPRLSADGRYVVFQSRATNLTAAVVSPPGWLIYRRDLATGATLLLSSPPTGAAPNAGPADLSTNGQIVAYADAGQVYVWDEAIGAAAMVSTNAAGQAGTGHAYAPLLSADGRVLVYLSDSADAIASATNGQYQVVVRNLVTSANLLASVGPQAPNGSGADCLFLSINPAGNVVTFQTFDDHLAPSDSNSASDVFVRELTSPGVELASGSMLTLPPVTAAGAAWMAEEPIGLDGRYVLFTSAAPNLTPNDTNGSTDVFVRDVALGTNLLVSVSQDGASPGNGASQFAAMTSDGRFVAFVSSATNLVAGDTNAVSDVFVRDLTAGTTVLASALPAGIARGPVLAFVPVISSDGRYTAFVQGTAGSGYGGIYLRDVQQATATALPGLTTWPGYAPSTLLRLVRLAPDRSLWFYAQTNTAALASLYRYDIASAASKLIGPSTTLPVVTPDGRFAAGQFLRQAGGQYTNEVWRYDAQSNAFQVITLNVSAGLPPSARWRLALSANGQFLAFASPVSLSPLAQKATTDVYVADVKQPGSFILVSVNQAGTSGGNGPSDSPSLSADGRFVAFRSTATDLAPGTASGIVNLFVRDLQLGVTRLVSVNPAGTEGNNEALAGWISADGTTVAFASAASDLIPGDYNNLPDAFVYHVPREPLVRLRLLPFGVGQPPTIVWQGDVAKTYRIQFKNLLSDALWQALPGTPVPSGASELQYQDTSADRGNQRYYRVTLPP